MDQEKIDAAIRYFRIHERASAEHKEDVDKDAQSFKLSFEKHGTLLAKISNELLEDTAADDIPQLLDRIELYEQLKELKGTNQGLLLTSKGVEKFTR